MTEFTTYTGEVDADGDQFTAAVDEHNIVHYGAISPDGYNDLDALFGITKYATVASAHDAAIAFVSYPALEGAMA